MEEKVVCCRCAITDHDSGHVPALAFSDETGCLVLEYGHAWAAGVVLRDGNRSNDSVRGDDVHASTWSLAVPESVRGRGILRFVQTCMGMA